MNAAQVVAVLLTGALFGHELATMFVHLALHRLPAADHLAAEQRINGILSRVMPVFMVGTVVAIAVASAANEGRARSFDVVALAAVVAMLVVTLVGNIPINIRTMALGPDVDTSTWRAMRRRWNIFHAVRVGLLAGGFALVAMAGR